MDKNSIQATTSAKGVAVVLALVFAVTASYVAYRYNTLELGMSKVPLTDEARKLASTLFFDRMTALAQLTLGLLGATWALLSLAETRVEIRDWPAVSCFVLVNLAYAASLLLYMFGYNLIVKRMFHHLAFDTECVNENETPGLRN